MGIGGVGGVHSHAHVKSVSPVRQVGQGETGDTQAVARTDGPKRDTFRSDFSSLVKAVQGGDIGAAQSALTTLQSDVTSTSATYSPASTSSPETVPAASASQNDLGALFQAVRAGDIAGAKAALGQLQLDVRSGGDHASLQGQIHGRGHGRGHGHQGSTLRADVVAAFVSQASAPAEPTTPVVDPASDAEVLPLPSPETSETVPASVELVSSEPVPALFELVTSEPGPAPVELATS